MVEVRGEVRLKILVTGGAGFIGSHLSRYLVSKGHKVVILDNMSSGSYANIRGLDHDGFYAQDCQNVPFLEHVSRGCDYIYHCASTVGVQKVLRDPAGCIENILTSTRAVLGLGVPGMYFSTSEVYGKHSPTRVIQGFPSGRKWAEPTGELLEECECTLSSAPRWSYAAAKLCGEWLALSAGWQVVRLFNVIGEGQNAAYGAVFPRFVAQALEDKPLTIYGDGSQVRTFTSVRDTVDILDRLRGNSMGVVNVGSSNTLSIRQLAIEIKEALHSQSLLDFVPYEKAYPSGFEECPSRVPDLTKLRSIIGDYKFTKLESIIKEMSKWVGNSLTTA